MLCSVVFLSILILSTTSTVVAFGNLFTDITLLPNNPVVEEGTGVILNCTIKPNYNGSFSYRNISFFRNANEQIDARYVQFVAPRSALLTLQDVSFQHAGHIWCCLPDRPIRTTTATQDIQVYRRPLTPVVTGCIINNWESMTCSWTPTVQEQHDHTLTQSVFYHLRWKQQSTSVWRECPHYSTDESCEWLFQDVQETTDEELVDEETYCVQVFTEDALKVDSISTEYCFQPQQIVMLSQLSVSVESVNSSHGTVSWSYTPVNHEHNYTTLEYGVSVVSPGQPETSLEIIDDLSATFHLIPFTNYTISVKVRPFQSTFWSASSTTTLHSLPAVPARGPAVSPSTFRTLQTGHKLRRIMLFWKSLPLRDRHGPDFHYIIMQRNETTRTWFPHTFIVPGNQSSTVVVVNNAIAHVALLSCNVVGCSNASTIVRLPDSTSSLIDKISPLLIVEGDNRTVFVEGDSQGVFLSWKVNSNEEKHFMYTIVWCRSHHVFGLCDGSIDWVDVSLGVEVDQWNLTVADDYRVYLFGLAISVAVGNNERDSTGIQWINPVFSYNGLANPPRNVKAGVSSNGTESELLVTWSHPSFSIDQGHIKAYSVFYCELNATNQCTGDPCTMLVPGNEQKGVLNGLKPKTSYKIWIHSVTRTGLSAHGSARVFAETTESMLTVGVIIGAVVFLLLVVICSAIFFVVVFRYCRRLRRKLTAGITIRVPTAGTQANGQGMMLNNLNSSPVVEYSRIVYSRQGSRLSSTSRDSGHFGVSFSPSVSPQNGGMLTSPLLPNASKTIDFHYSMSPTRFNHTNLPADGPKLNDSCSGNPSAVDSLRIAPPVSENVAKTYINSDHRAPSDSCGQLSGYQRLAVLQQSSSNADSEGSKSAPPQDVEPAYSDNVPHVVMPPPLGLPPAESSLSSGTVVSYSAPVSNANSDCGYVQHDEWLSKVLGIAT